MRQMVRPKLWFDRFAYRLRRSEATERGSSKLIAAVEATIGTRIDQSIRESPEHAVLERVADTFELDRYELLARVAAALGLRPVFSPAPPDSALLSASGYSRRELRDRAVVPQRSERLCTEWTLVTAAPSLIAVGEFMRAGTEVLLGLGRDIERAWALTDQTAEAALGVPLTRMLIRMANESLGCGASELFLGLPDEGHYEFVSGAKRYRGTVSPSLVRALARTVGELRRVTITASEPIRTLALTLTRSLAGAVICMSWECDSSGDAARAAACSSEPIVRSRSESGGGQRGDDIVVLDDDLRFSAILSRMLQAKGYSVERATDGNELLRSLEARGELPFLLICDVHMRPIDGRDLILRLKRRFPSIRVIALTNDEAPEVEAELALRGADARISKSRDPMVLLSWVRCLGDRARRETGV